MTIINLKNVNISIWGVNPSTINELALLQFLISIKHNLKRYIQANGQCDIDW